jgi:hypothetical protein
MLFVAPGIEGDRQRGPFSAFGSGRLICIKDNRLEPSSNDSMK